MAHRTQKNSLFTRSWVYYKRIELRNGWERCTEQGGEGAQSSHALSGRVTLPECPRVHQPGSSLNSILWGFMEASLQRQECWNHWPLAIDSTSGPHPPEVGSGTERWFPLAPSPHPEVLPRGHLINMNSGVVEKGLLWIRTFLSSLWLWFQEPATKDQTKDQAQ